MANGIGYPPHRNRPTGITREVGRIVRDLQKEIDKPAIDANYYNTSGGSTTSPGTSDICVTSAFVIMETSALNLEDFNDDAGNPVSDSVLVTSADADSCIEFDWLDSDRIPRIVFGEGSGIPPEAFAYGLDDIYDCFDWRYDSVAGLWSPSPIEFFTPIEGEPLKLKRAIIVGVPVAPGYPRGFRIDPVQMGIGWEIHLQQFISGGMV